MIRTILALGFLAALSASPLLAAPPDTVDFNHHIRPLLSDRCYACHGPDEKARKAKLRLDTETGARRAPRKAGGASILVSGNPSESELYRRIISTDPDERMPPPESKLSLSNEEVELVRRWIEAGAEWKSHWAFIPPREDAPLPSVSDSSWARNPIDSFVLDRLESAGLRPESEATRERLLRRVSLDLTGLPPSVDAIDAFLADRSHAAYERVVDRLLASPAYGERMAVDWLDVARFADTFGYQSDRNSHLWPWRDWVIDQFNRNLPYDDFIAWQVAGDLLPGATQEQVLATAFNRNHRQTNEGGSINEEFRVEYNADRVKTTALAFLGLTMECARCHDHKYDPITQKDYYRFFAFFNSTDESGLYSHYTDATPSPTLLLYAGGQADEHRDMKLEITRKSQALSRRQGASREDFERWLEDAEKFAAGRPAVGDVSFERVETVETGEGDEKKEEKRVPNAAKPELFGKLADSPRIVEGRHGKAFEFDGENGVTFDKLGNFGRTDPFSFSLWLRIPEVRDKIIVFHRARSGSDAGSRGYELLLEDGRASFAVIHFWPGNAIKVGTLDKLPLNEWLHFGISYDGSSRAAGIRLFVNGKPAASEILRDNLFKDIHYDPEDPPLRLASRNRGRGFKQGGIDSLKVFDRRISALEMSEIAEPGTLAVLRAREQLTREEVDLLHEHYLLTVDEPYAESLAELVGLRKAENDLVNSIPEIMVMGDRPEPRPTYVLGRGAYDAPGEVVSAGTPEGIFPLDPDLPRNRLGLAGWLVDPKNPLPARVTVNRYWQLYFGRGLVETSEDFGSQGKLPSHPELIDWLAAWFVKSGWNTKALGRLIVTSATYRQSSSADAEKMARDPENRLLARGPSHRLSAETLRDSVLSASGLLDRQLGGPSVKAIDDSGHRRKKDDGKSKAALPRKLRRTLYTFVRRSATSPYLLTFDATGREDCIARRQSTNTPLQALVLLNDALFHEASKRLALRMEREGGQTMRERIVFAFQSVTGRRPGPRELELLTELHADQRALFDSEPKAVAALLEGLSADEYDEIGRSQLAASAVLANAILNFDESIMKR